MSQRVVLSIAASILSGLVVAQPARPATTTLARAETLYVTGDFAAAEAAFAALKPAPGDTTVVLRRASLQMLRDQRAAARATLAPLLSRTPVPRAAKAIMAESYARDLDFARSAPFQRELGREAIARQMESFADTTAYRYEGPDQVTLKFVQTDPLPLVEVQVNGRGPYLFLIDTGGGSIVIDPVLADSLGVPRFGETEGTFGGGRRRAVTQSRVSSLGLGAATFHDLPAALLDCSRFSAVAWGRRVWGIIGTHLFMRVRATLDYPAGALVLERRRNKAAGGTATSDSTRHVMPMWLGGDHYMVARGQLGNGPETLWFVDTGLAGAGLTAPTSALQEAGIAVPDTSSVAATGIGGGGNVKAQMFPVERFRLGTASAQGVMGVFGAFPPTLERGFGYRIAGIISHGFFRAWRLTFDFDAMQLVLEQPKPAATK